MTSAVRELPKAKEDKLSIFRWISERSPVGALAWLDAYDAAIARLANYPDNFGFAQGNVKCELDWRLRSERSVQTRPDGGTL